MFIYQVCFQQVINSEPSALLTSHYLWPSNMNTPRTTTREALNQVSDNELSLLLVNLEAEGEYLKYVVVCPFCIFVD